MGHVLISRPWGLGDGQDRAPAHLVPCTAEVTLLIAGLLSSFDLSWTHLDFIGERRRRYFHCYFKLRKEKPGKF